MARKRKIHRGKVKRNRPKGFGRRRKKSRAGAVIFVLVIIALVIGAYCAAGPLMNLLSGSNPEDGASSQLSSAPAEGTSSREGTSSQNASSNTAAETSGRVKTMPAGNLTDLNKVKSFAAEAKQEGYTAVSVELKNSEGGLLYNSASQRAKKYGAVKNKNVSLSEVAKTIQDAGLAPVAKLHMFKDKTAANREYDNTFKIKGENSTWWDNSPSKGGKPWLNPYKDEAVNYLLEIIGETMDAGFSQVVLDSVQFPDVRNTSIIEFPSGANKDTHQQKLAEFIEKAQNLAAEKKCLVTVAYNTLSILGKKDNIYFGNPLKLNAKSISPIIQISQFGNTLDFGGKKVEAPKEHPAEAVTALIEGIRAQAPDAQIIPILSSDAKTDEIRNALTQAGIKEIVEQ